jgi:ferric-dicitrate binding protein FerR (iron transport regulator)
MNNLIQRGLQLIITSSLIASCAAVVCGQQQSTARIAFRNGLVEVQRGNAWSPISLGDTLNAGDRLRTASGSVAAVELGPDRIVTLDEASQIQVGQSNVSPIVQLESGSIKVFSAFDILVAAKDTLLESADRPLDMELGFDGDKVNLTVFAGAVRNGSITVHAGDRDSSVRTITAGSRAARRNELTVPYTIFAYPYFLYGNAHASDGRIVPPVVNNPTNPSYRPTQIVPPMSDPVRVPVTKP